MPFHLHLAGVVGAGAATAAAAAAAAARRWGARSLPALSLAHAAVVGCVVALAATDACAPWSTGLLGKDPATGRLAPWSLLLFAPYHLALRSKLALQRSRSAEPLWNEVAPGWFLGGWPPSDGALPPGAGAVLDVTAELPRAAAGGGREYACFRVWDTHAPSPAALDAAVRWARKQRAGGAGVYVHCAHGHGRSAAVLAACLLDQGAATDVDGAVGVLRAARPRARLNHRQRGAVEAWWAEREGGKGR